MCAQLYDEEILISQLSKETKDTNRIKLLIQLGLIKEFFVPEQIGRFKEVYELSKKTKFRYGLAYAPFYEAILLWQGGRYDEAIAKNEICIERLDSLGVIQSIDSPLGIIRFMFNSTGKQAEKFQYYVKKAAYYKQFGPKENIANCYHGIAGYYVYLGDNDKAIEYYLRARDIYVTFDPFCTANEVAVIGYHYLLWGNLEMAEHYLESALKDFLRMKNTWLISYCYNHLGDLCLQRRDYERALQYYFSDKKYWHELPPEYIAMDMVSIAAVHLHMNSYDSAGYYLAKAQKVMKKASSTMVTNHGPVEIDYHYYLYYKAINNQDLALKKLEAALVDAMSLKYIPLVLKYTNELHLYLLKKGDSLQSFRFLVQYHALRDSVDAMNTMARIATFEIEQQRQQKEHEIEQLQTQKATQLNYYIFVSVLLLLIAIGIFSRFRYKRKRDKEQLTTDFKKQLAQAETKALRAQMNPHFIFNSLNSINSFVIDQQHELASEYLIKFSKLIRLILDNSRSETISIEKELETLKLYVLLEAARFDNKFKCVYHIASDVNTSSIMIPPMLLQPFVENAIWHGLMQKEGEGTIVVELAMKNEELLMITIEDDGIGREKADKLKSKSATHKSHGLKVTSQRIEMMNKLNSTGAQVHIVDLKDDQGNARGTRVELIIPF